MLTIRRGQTIIKVSNKTYEKVFKKKGFIVISENKTEMKTEAEKTEKENGKKVDVETQEDEETEGQEIDVDSIPISSMNSDQLKEYAKNHGIEIPNVETLGEARRYVKAEIRKRKM